MTYAVHVDIEPPAGSSELDPLQREGVAALLDGRIARIASIDGLSARSAAHCLRAPSGTRTSFVFPPTAHLQNRGVATTS